MKNKIIYSFTLVFAISLIASAKKAPGCNVPPCCEANKQNLFQNKTNNEIRPEPAALSLFFFNI